MSREGKLRGLGTTAHGTLGRLKEPRLYLEKGCFALGWEWDLVVALNI
jgi:hypothetical protein